MKVYYQEVTTLVTRKIMENTEILLKALADKNRLRIIGLLAHRTLCVCELAYILEITQPSVSKHLKKLKSSGIINSKQDGLWTVYFLATKFDKDNWPILDAIISKISKLNQIKEDIRGLKQVSRDDLCYK